MNEKTTKIEMELTHNEYISYKKMAKSLNSPNPYNLICNLYETEQNSIQIGDFFYSTEQNGIDIRKCHDQNQADRLNSIGQFKKLPENFDAETLINEIQMIWNDSKC